MNDEQQLKSLRGTCRLLNDIGVLAECPRLEDALVEAIQKLTKQVEGDSSVHGVEESLQRLFDKDWTVQISMGVLEEFVVVATKDGARYTTEDETLSGALEFLVKKALPLIWAGPQTKKK